jgi:hypothetical protein
METADRHVAELRDHNAELEAKCAAMEWGVKNARWIRHDHEAYVAIPVAVDADLSCVAMRYAAIAAAIAREKEGK